MDRCLLRARRSASGALTGERMGWEPTQVGLIADLAEVHYFQVAAAA
jgi:hypothetical protein